MGPSGPIFISESSSATATMRLATSLLRVENPLLAYLLVVPTLVSGLYLRSDHDASRAWQLLALLLAAAAWSIHALRRGPARPERTASPAPATLGAALAVLAIASVVASEQPAMAARELALVIGLAAAAAGLADGLTRSSTAAAHTVVVVACGTYAAMLVGLAAASAASGLALSWPSMALGYDNYRFFNHVQTVAVPMLALVAADPRRHAVLRRSALFAIAVYWAYVLCSGARGTALALAGGVVLAVAAVGWRCTWPVLRQLAVGAALGTALYAAVFVALPSVGLIALAAPAERSAASMASDSARLQLWRIAADQIASAPWLGIGPMHYAHQPNPKAAHPHNVYLQVAAEWGIPMLVAMLALAASGLLRLRAAVRAVGAGPAGTEGAGLLIACLAVLLDGLVSGTFVMPVSQMWIALCVGWTLAWMRLNATAAAPRPPSTRGAAPFWWAALVALGSQAWLMWSVWPEVVDPSAHLEQVHRDIVRNAKTNPRFWSDGWF